MILQAKNITAMQFAEEIGIQASGMSHIMGGRNNPSLGFVSKVLHRYPEIDANWLLLGRGEMYTTAASATPLPTTAQAPAAAAPKAAATPAQQTTAATQTPVEPAESPTLFSFPYDRPEAVPSEPTQAAEPQYQAAYIAVPPSDVAATERPAATAAPAPQATESAIARIIIMYADNSFEVLHPRS